MPLVAPPRLIAISDLSVAGDDVVVERLGRLASAARAGTVALLLRDHGASARQRLALGQELAAAARSAGQQMWVADRLDLALLLAADVVHLGEASVSAATARRLLGAGTGVSRAWHATSLAGAREAEELAGVDALLVSPLLLPRKGRAALGLGVLGTLGAQLRARHQACQLYALGGVTADHVAACIDAGATGVAAIGAALAADVEPLLRALGIRR